VTGQWAADLAAATQTAIVDVLVSKSVQALNQTGLKRLVIAGGVGANARLRAQLTSHAQKIGAQVFYPPVHLCTDNGAMIAYAAAERINAGLEPKAPRQGFNVYPRWPLIEIDPSMVA
jgi:N6-L-threonylcarbamoyladenine synthase